LSNSSFEYSNISELYQDKSRMQSKKLEKIISKISGNICDVQNTNAKLIKGKILCDGNSDRENNNSRIIKKKIEI